MPSIKKVSDQVELARTKDYPYANWSYEYFNPIQSRIMDFYHEDCNALVAASTSSGKSLIAEMFLAHEIRERKGKGIFLVPLRALAQEKIDQWTNESYHFKGLNISVCTGDYRLTKERTEELNNADLIIMTSELLNHRIRNSEAENSEFLKKCGTIVIDEAHGIGSPDRGSHLEAGLMKFTELNPSARVVFLSATMPNVEELAEWLSYSLTGRETYVLNSKFRPVPLNIHYETYDDVGKYDRVEESKIDAAMDIIEDYPDDKFLVFAHTKRSGEMMKNALKAAGIATGFHSADLSKDERVKLEKEFRTNKNLKVVVATSTLAAGINMPARRVIVLGVTRGINDVETHEIIQECGRSGRLGIDVRGDAYVLLPESKEQLWRNKLKTPQLIQSQLLEKEGEHHKVLAFHLVSEIYHGYIKTNEDVRRWYKRSLAYFQNQDLKDFVVDNTLDLLLKRGAIRFENNIWETTPVGKISSLFYFSPFDVSDLRRNFWDVFNNENEDNDYHLSMALGNLDSQRTNIVSRAEKEEISLYASKIRNLMNNRYVFSDGALKAGYCYYNLLNGNSSQYMSAMMRNFQFDYNRVSQVLMAIDGMSAKWDRTEWFRTIEQRIQNGVPAYLLNLCKIPNIGKVRAKKLYENGIRNCEQFVDTPEKKLSQILNVKQDILQKMLSEAKLLTLS